MTCTIFCIYMYRAEQNACYTCNLHAFKTHFRLRKTILKDLVHLIACSYSWSEYISHFNAKSFQLWKQNNMHSMNHNSNAFRSLIFMAPLRLLMYFWQTKREGWQNSIIYSKVQGVRFTPANAMQAHWCGT